MNHAEATFARYLDKGYFAIDKNGAIWRLRVRRKQSKKGLTWAKLDHPRRAEAQTSNYLVVQLELYGRKQVVMAHRAVYQHWVGPIPDGHVVNHKNGVKTDNRPSNLEAVTQSENVLHAIYVLGTR